MVPELESPDALPDTRYLARITIYYGLDPESLMNDYSINISNGGIYIETDRILPEGTVLTVKFNLPGTDFIIYTHARVAWINDPDNPKKITLPPGMGIQFLSTANQNTIRNFLEKSNLDPAW